MSKFESETYDLEASTKIGIKMEAQLIELCYVRN